MHENGKEIH